MAAGFPRVSDPIENEQHPTHLYNLVSKSHIITHLFYSLEVHPNQLEGITTGREYQEAGIIGNHLEGWLPQ